MEKSLTELQQNKEMVSLIKAMFDIDEDVSVLERNILEKKTMMKLVFNYVDLFFQLILVTGG